MKQRMYKNIKVAVLLVVAAALGINFIPASAAETANTANTLKVSPVRTDIEVNAGESKPVKATVTNLTNAPIVVRAVGNDFVAGDERGTPALILADDEFAPSHSLKRFMSPIPDVTIPAKAAVTVESVITVPQGAKAGGYFGAIRFAPTTPDEGGQVNMSASVASLVLLTVPGDVEEKLTLTNFDIQQDGNKGTYFRSSNNIEASVRFKNEGGIQLGPIGKVSVKKGNDVIYEADFNNKNPRDMTLPGSARRWDIPLEKIGGFGKYTVVATFTYGKNNQSIEVSKSFWVIPLPIIAGIIGAIVLVIAIIIFLQRYKRRILKQHGYGSIRHR